jgi:hypothetical protein
MGERPPVRKNPNESAFHRGRWGGRTCRKLRKVIDFSHGDASAGIFARDDGGVLARR